MDTTPLPYPSRTMRSSEAFQVPGQPQDASQFASADAYNDMLRSRVIGDIDTNRLNDANRGYYQATPNELADMAGNTKFGISSGMAQRELNSRSNEGEFAVPGYGDLGQFAGGGNDNFASKFGGSASFNALKDDNPYNVSAFANGGEAQAPAANPFADPNTMAVYDQMRQTVSPKEFSDEILAGASQVDPQEVAKFKAELDKLDVPMEVLDMLNNMVDEVLANPDNYAQVKQKYEAMGVTEDLLPAEFDGHFFSALNMAVDQMIAEPAGEQAFAKGGIAELKPISKAVADYGRNGDTMLAHITPAEARMLRRKGGAGTTNPKTGLKEYFSLGKLFKSIGNAIKSFASSTVGKVVTTVALGFFLGPAAASMVGATSAAGVAAVSGFVGSAGSTLLGGGNLKDALKAGAIGGLTAGAIGGATQGFDTAYQGPTTVGGQVDKFTGMLKSPSFPEYTAQGALTDNATSNAAREAYAGNLYKTNPEAFYNPIQAPSISATGEVASMAPTQPYPAVRPDEFSIDAQKYADTPAIDNRPFVETPPNANEQVYRPPTAPSGIQQQGMPAAEQAGKAAQDALLARSPSATPAMLETAYQTAYKNALPGVLSTYGPMAAAGIGALALGGGFKPTQARASTLRPELMKPVTQRIAEGGNQRNYYVQGLPGVKYDQYGAPIFGQNMPLPTFETGLGITALMNPKGYADGGSIAVGYAGGGLTGVSDVAKRVVDANNFDETAYLNANPDVKAAIAKGDFANAYEHYSKFGQAEGRTAFDKAETAAAAATVAAEKEAAQAANRKAVADAKAAKKAAGFTNAYQNINAGLSYDVPAGIAATAIAARQAAFKPTMDKFTESRAANAATLAKPYTPTVVDQPYNNTTGYTNVLNPVAPPINYDTTPELTAAQKAAADKLAVDPAAAAAAAAAAKAAADKAAADKLAADRAAAAKAAADKPAADRTIFQGQPVALQNQQIMDYLKANPNATDQTLAKEMDYWGIKAPQVAQVTGMQGLDPSSVQNIDYRYSAAKAANEGNQFFIDRQNKANAVTGQSIRDFFAKNPGMGDEQIANYMDANSIDPAQMQYAFAGTPGAISSQDVLKRYNAAITGPTRKVFATDSLPTPPAAAGGVMQDMAMKDQFGNYITGPAVGATNPVEKKLLNMGGIASLGSGGYPRRTGQISGPGTATSDSIPAMLSDGEFVMTAKAVRGAGKGDKRAGAKRMYALMNQLEKNAARG